MPVIPATQEASIRQFEAIQGKQFARPYLEKANHKKRLMEWLKVEALSSNPSTKKDKNILNILFFYSKPVIVKLHAYMEHLRNFF
jgi:hypothetical protein